MPKDTLTPDYDIIVAGGGMIGTSLGLALAPLNLRVAIVEAVPRTAIQQPSFDDRSTALSRSSQRMFEAIGLWPEIIAASTPISSIHVSEKGRFGFSHIDATEQKVEALGYVVINRVLGNVLQQSLENVPGLDVICPGTISAVSADEQAARVTVTEGDSERELSCKLVVAADGANSAVREMIGISAIRKVYEEWAVVGNLLPEEPHRNRAFERFTESGPLAMLPVEEDRMAFVWSQKPDTAKATLDLTDEAFTESIQSAFGYRLGKFSKAGKRAAYPLALSKANGLYSDRAVLVGNAAHGLHPVAAQGFNLGLRDVAALCDCIATGRQSTQGGFDAGSPVILETYTEWRRSDHTKLVRFTDGLVRLFADQRRPVRALRNLGMLAFDTIPGVRKTFAKHTMGLTGRLPRLSRGVPLK